MTDAVINCLSIMTSQCHKMGRESVRGFFDNVTAYFFPGVPKPVTMSSLSKLYTQSGGAPKNCKLLSTDASSVKLMLWSLSMCGWEVLVSSGHGEEAMTNCVSVVFIKFQSPPNIYLVSVTNIDTNIGQDRHSIHSVCPSIYLWWYVYSVNITVVGVCMICWNAGLGSDCEASY